jgi:hypothetical protein
MIMEEKENEVGSPSFRDSEGWTVVTDIEKLIRIEGRMRELGFYPEPLYEPRESDNNSRPK